MARLTVTIFYDPKAPDSESLVERMASIGPSIGVGVTYVDITKDRELMKRYKSVAPVGTMAGTIVFSGGLDEQMLRSRVRSKQKRG
jgi:hypothetical protein